MKTIKLCDGWLIRDNGTEVFRTEDYQEVRKWFWIEEGASIWSDITRELVCFGTCSLDLEYDDGTTHRVVIEVIPCGEY